MKIILTFILAVLLSSLSGQDISAEELFTKVVIEEIPIFDTKDKLLSEAEIFNLLFLKDTTINCFNTLEGVFHNIYILKKSCGFGSQFKNEYYLIHWMGLL